MGQVLDRAGAPRHLPLPSGRHPVPGTQPRRRSPPCPNAPQWVEVGFSPRMGARRSKRLTMVSPRATRPNSLFGPLPPAAVCLYGGADLRPPFAPEEERVSMPAAAATPSFVPHSPRGGGTVRHRK